jgi:hypothetical protein
VAIPTDFKGFTPAAGTTKTFKILGSATVGVWGCDVDGTLSTAPLIVNLAPNMVIFSPQAYTEAQILAVLKDYLKRSGFETEGDAGGFPAQPAQQIGIVSTTTA